MVQNQMGTTIFARASSSIRYIYPNSFGFPGYTPKPRSHFTLRKSKFHSWKNSRHDIEIDFLKLYGVLVHDFVLYEKLD